MDLRTILLSWLFRRFEDYFVELGWTFVKVVELGIIALFELFMMPSRKKSNTGISSSNNYDSVKFWNKEAQKLYTFFLTRPIVREKEIGTSQEIYEVGIKIERRGLGRVCPNAT